MAKVRKIYVLGNQQEKDDESCPQRLWAEMPVGGSPPKCGTPKRLMSHGE